MEYSQQSDFLSTAIRLVNAGFAPIALNGKIPIRRDWQSQMPGWASQETMEAREAGGKPFTMVMLQSWERGHDRLNVGVNCREAFALDIDIPVDDERFERIREIMRATLPTAACVKQGAKGDTHLWRNGGVKSRSFKLIGGGGIDLLGDGKQTVLPPSIHPLTGAPYVWSTTAWGEEGVPLWDCRHLSVIQQRHIDAFVDSLAGAGLISLPKTISSIPRNIAPLSDRDIARYSADLSFKMRDKLAAIASGSGGRADAINSAAMSMACYANAGIISKDELQQRLYEAAASAGFHRDHGGNANAFQYQFDRGFDYGTQMIGLRDLDAAVLGGFPSASDPNALEGVGRRWKALEGVGNEAPPPVVSVEMLRGHAVSLWDEIEKPIVEREWSVQGLFPHGDISSLYAQGGMGKTTLFMHLGIAMAFGRPWLGVRTTRRRVLFITGENKQRDLVDMGRAMTAGLTPTPDTIFRMISLRELGAMVKGFPSIAKCNRDGESIATELFIGLCELVRAEGFDAVILDPIGMLFSGNQNDLTSVYSLMHLLCSELCDLPGGVTVLISAHPSKSGRKEGGDGTSGSVGWDSGPRAVSIMRRCKLDTTLFELEQVKSSYGPPLDKIHFRRVADGFMRASPPTPEEVARMDLASPVCALFLELLAERNDGGRHVSANPSRSYAPTQFAAWKKGAAYTKEQYSDAMDALLYAKKIVVTSVGPESRKRSYLEVCSSVVSDEGD